MPNHVKNRLEFKCSFEQLNEVIKTFGTHVESKIETAYDGKSICTNDEGSVCWIDLPSGVVSFRDRPSQYGLPEGFTISLSDSFLKFPDFAKVIPPPVDDPAYHDKPSQDAARHSPNWWHTWNSNNWGSKWGGYSYRQESINVFTFETAWRNAASIIAEMSKRFPDVTIFYSWADEDMGSNCGKQIYHNGLLQSEKPDSQSLEAYDIAFELWPERKQDFVLIGDTYRYAEE
jgi:hypothetical protein